MVSPVQYLRAYTGIDLALPVERQSLSAVDNVVQRQGTPGASTPVRPSTTEAIYDAVVGVDRVGNCNFDQTGEEPERLHASGLGKLSRIAREMQSKAGASPSTRQALSAIGSAAATYQDLLVGNRQRIPKDLNGLGSRHTLVRGVNCTIFEMTNSMSEAEVATFRRKTAMHVNAVERPAGTDVEGGQTTYKIVLGVGGFGTARIARNIMNDTYVAVKKTHPTIDVSESACLVAQPAPASNFTELRERVDFERVADAVIAPTDECMTDSKHAEQVNRLAEDLNTLRTGFSDEVARRVAQTPQMKALRASIGPETYAQVMFSVLMPSTPRVRTDNQSNYSFSQLGIASVGNFIERFNVIRFHLERSNAGGRMSPGAIELMKNHAACEDIPGTQGASSSELARRHTRLGTRRFEQKDFMLKDPVYNQRFLNTLGRDMLSALAKLHTHPGGPIVHRDVKPDNVVLCQEADRTISTKLIDLDLIEEQPAQRELPDIGCRVFMPPEAFVPERDDSIAYDTKKADAYAMGASLRLLVGFGMKDIAEIAMLLQGTALVSWMDAQKMARTDQAAADHLNEIKARLKSLSPDDDNHIQNQLRVQAIMNATPEAVTLKDIADLMLKDHPGKRFLPADALKLPFFQDRNNFLPREEFSNHANEAVRFMQVIDKDEALRVNDMLEVTTKNLREVRRVAAHAALASRRQTSASSCLSTLSKSEEKKVDSAERSLQSKAVIRRGLRALSGSAGAGSSIADEKLNYVRRVTPG